jgi:hypothetical protein
LQIQFATGDVIIVSSSTGDVTTSFAAEVIACQRSTDLERLVLTYRRKTSGTAFGPLHFDSPEASLFLPPIGGHDSLSVSLAVQNTLSVDQYKIMYGHPDLRYQGSQYFVRVNHSQCGDLILGSVCTLNGSRYIFAGAVADIKKKAHCLLFPEASRSNAGASRKLVRVPLTKAVGMASDNISASEIDTKAVLELLCAESEYPKIESSVATQSTRIRQAPVPQVGT